MFIFVIIFVIIVINLPSEKMHKMNTLLFLIKKCSKSDKFPKAENGRKFCPKVVGVSKNGQK